MPILKWLMIESKKLMFLLGSPMLTHTHFSNLKHGVHSWKTIVSLPKYPDTANPKKITTSQPLSQFSQILTASLASISAFWTIDLSPHLQLAKIKIYASVKRLDVL